MNSSSVSTSSALNAATTLKPVSSADPTATSEQAKPVEFEQPKDELWLAYCVIA